MKFSVDELRDRADGGSGTTSEPEPEPKPSPEPDPGGGGSSQLDFTVQEFLDFKQKEQRLHEELQQQDETSLADSLKEFLSDPQSRQMLHQLWYGTEGRQQQRSAGGADRPALGDGGDRAALPAEPTPAQTAEQPAADPDMADNQHTITTDQAYQMLTHIINNVAEMEPNLTAEEMAQNAEEMEPVIKQQLGAKLAEFQG